MDTRSKIVSVEDVAGVCAGCRRVVLAAGCFDVLHAGHVRFIRELSNDGAALVVAVYDDATLCRLRGQPRPVLQAQARAQLVAALAGVDYVVVWPEPALDALVKRLAPERVEHAPDGERNIIEEVLERHHPR